MEEKELKSHLEVEEKVLLKNQISEIYNFIKIEKFCKLIPEVRTNIAGALQNAKEKENVAGIDGRITIVNGMPKAAGEIKFGAAEHTARLLLTAKKYDNTINFVINLKFSQELIDNISSKTKLQLVEIKREEQPEDIKRKEFSTMQWLIKKCVNKTGKVPDIIWDKGSIGKEPMIRIFAKNSAELIEKLKKIIQLI
ncbi:MAG: thiamine-phosphate synthase family protein [Promethearchaeota archaeon]